MFTQMGKVKVQQAMVLFPAGVAALNAKAEAAIQLIDTLAHPLFIYLNDYRPAPIANPSANVKAHSNPDGMTGSRTRGSGGRMIAHCFLHRLYSAFKGVYENPSKPAPRANATDAMLSHAMQSPYSHVPLMPEDQKTPTRPTPVRNLNATSFASLPYLITSRPPSPSHSSSSLPAHSPPYCHP